MRRSAVQCFDVSFRNNRLIRSITESMYCTALRCTALHEVSQIPKKLQVTAAADLHTQNNLLKVKMEIDEELIELVRQSKFLYDKSSRSFKKVDLKNAQWQEIAEKLNCTADEVKKKWRTIRDRYNRIKKNSELPSGSGANKTKGNSYKYAKDLLSFLDECSSTNERTSNNYESSSDSLTYNDFSQEASDNDCSRDVYLEDTSIVIEDSSSELYSYEPITSNVLESSTPTSGQNKTHLNKRRKLLDEVLITNTNTQILKIMSSLQDDLKSKTKESSFCENLATQLQEAELPTEIFSKFQLAVYEAFNQAVIEKRGNT